MSWHRERERREERARASEDEKERECEQEKEKDPKTYCSSTPNFERSSYENFSRVN